MSQYPKNPRKQIPRATRFNREALQRSPLARCTYCLEIFEPSLIQDWLKEASPQKNIHQEDSETALCPFCGIDKVTPFQG